MNSMNENDDDGEIGNFPMVAVAAVGRAVASGGGGGGGGDTTQSRCDGASATWSEFGYNPDNYNSDFNSGSVIGGDLQINDHPMVSFSDTGGMGMAVAGGTNHDEVNDYYGDKIMQVSSMKCPSSPRTITTNNNACNISGEHSNEAALNFHPDLPFLVTHWLSTFAPPPPAPRSITTSTPFSSSPRLLAQQLPVNDDAENNAIEDKRKEALKLIRHHASSLANAFQSLGAFGWSSSSSNVGTNQSAATWNCRPTTYADMTRKYSQLLDVALPSSTSSRGHCLDRHGNQFGALLGALVCASVREDDLRNDNMKGSSAITPWSLLEASHEGSIPLPHTEDGADSAIVSAASSTTSTVNGRSSSKSSSFRLPGRKVGELTSSSSSLDASSNKDTNYEHITSSGDIITSSMVGRNAHNANSSSLYCAASIRAAVASRTHIALRREVHSQRREIECNRTALRQSTKKQSEFTEQVGGIGNGFDGGDFESNNPQRIVAHLSNRRVTLQSKYTSIVTKLDEAEREAKHLYKESTSIRRQYHDAYKINGQPSSLHQMLRGKSGSLNLGYGPVAHAPGTNNLVLPSILSRQYHPRHKISSASQTRLSVLKSRLSHASTINCHLIYPVYCLKFDKTGKYFITGADDQVAKVFHLGAGPRKTAISSTTHDDQSSTLPFNYCANVRGAVLVCSLRGHANVISDLDVSSDNSLLATASGDGDVRIWGLKDGWPVAILRGHKGGVNWVSWSLLSPYRVVTCGDDGYARMWDVRGAAEKRYGSPQLDIEQKQTLVQLPVQPESNDVLGAAINASANIVGLGLQRAFGEFVFNDHIDDGVKLMASLQHSSVTPETEASLRSTSTGLSKEVRVLCIARCPTGGHFATGSDDGVGRVWIDDDYWLTERQHCEFMSDYDFTTQFSEHVSPRVPPRERLLTSLRGHNKRITEIKYSSAGDRLLTASDNDGNVCIWSGFPMDAVPSRFLNVSKLFINLSLPSRCGNKSKVRCDGVAWTCDDLNVVTLQSIPASATRYDVSPGSHMIYVWDSYSGKCLMGVKDSHTAVSIALAPHPFLTSVVAVAGLDGCVKVWDLDRGDCFYTHVNSLLNGPVEQPTDRGKRCGCIEVQFSPDGLNLVVTDDSGRVTILDTQVPAWLRSGADSVEKVSEQYFANDYYELEYEENGNCIEKGSEQPPHLAPGGVRCSHEGVPHSETMRNLFHHLKGPLPLPYISAVYDVRYRGTQSRFEGSMGRKYSSTQMKTISASRFESTVVLTQDGSLVDDTTLTRSASSTADNRHKSKKKTAKTTLSSRYHWVDYNDLADSGEDGEDQFDNDYQGPDDSSEDDGYSPYRQRGQTLGGRRGSRRTHREASDDESHEHRRSARASSRRATQQLYHELSSDDDHLQEMMSAHTKPSGKYVDDWVISGHMFKLPRGGGSFVHRSWLHRTTYQGRKCYCPQVGDSVVYVPKAHNDTLRRFPIHDYTPPWTSWPTVTSWPVVLCKVMQVRYRFPYETNYKSRRQNEKLMGVTAILSLEIVGVPSQTKGRTFPWPAPTFVSPADKRTRFGNMKQFDVSLFQSDDDEFIIPEYIYSWRLKELERSINKNGGEVKGIRVTVPCPPDSGCNGENMEDADYLNYTGRLVAIIESSEDEFHFSDSGYNALRLEWDTQDSTNKQDLAGFSVWSINIACPSCDAPAAPTMGEEVTNAVRAALRNIIRMDDNVKEWFFEQVDTAKFTDYLDMVEVPIHLSLIQMRLRSNYYTNKSSVIADMEQLKENCYKYNGDDNDFYDLACQMYDRFKSLVDAIEEPPALDIEHASTEVIIDRPGGSKDNLRSSQDARTQNLSRIEGASSDDDEQSHQPRSLSSGDKAIGATKRRPVRGRRTTLEDAQRSGSLQSSERNSTARSKTSKQAGNKLENEADSDDSSEDESVWSNEEGVPSARNVRNTRASSKAKSKNDHAKEVYEKEFGSRRKSSRTKSLPTYTDKGSEEEDYSENSADSEIMEDSGGEDDSDGNVPARQRETRNRNARTMPSRSRKATNETIAVLQQSKPTGGLRISLRAKNKPIYAEKNSDEDEDNECHASDGSDVNVSPRENARIGKRVIPKRTSSKPIENSRRRMPSRARRKTDSLENLGATSSSEDEEASDGETAALKENTRNGRLSRTTRSRSRYFDKAVDANSENRQMGGQRASPRAKSRKLYADIDSCSESRSEDKSKDDSSKEEEFKRSSRKRGSRQTDASDKKRARTQRQSTIIRKYPELEKWGPITRRKIFSIGTAILNKLRELDTLNLFSVPVLETHPSLSAAYKKKVKSPMDFQTIESERLPFYTHIADLQDDLILTFRNCCEFNGEMTEYYNYALVIWEMLNDVYNAVLEDKY